MSELVSQTKSDSAAHAQLPIQQEQGEQEIVTEDLEQHAQGQVRASTIMSLKIICIPGGRTQSRGVSFKGFHLRMTLCSRHSIVNEFLVSKETVVLRRWERSKQKFGFIKRVDKG